MNQCDCESSGREYLVGGIRYWMFFCQHLKAHVTRVIPGQPLLQRINR